MELSTYYMYPKTELVIESDEERTMFLEYMNLYKLQPGGGWLDMYGNFMGSHLHAISRGYNRILITHEEDGETLNDWHAAWLTRNPSVQIPDDQMLMHTIFRSFLSRVLREHSYYKSITQRLTAEHAALNSVVADYKRMMGK